MILISSEKIFSQDYLEKEAISTSRTHPNLIVVDDRNTYFYSEGKPCEGKIISKKLDGKEKTIKGIFKNALPIDSTFIYDELGNLEYAWLLHKDSLIKYVYKNNKLFSSSYGCEYTMYNNNGIRTKMEYGCLSTNLIMTFDSLGNKHSFSCVDGDCVYPENEIIFTSYYGLNCRSKFNCRGIIIAAFYKNGDINKIYRLDEKYYKDLFVLNEADIVKESIKEVIELRRNNTMIYKRHYLPFENKVKKTKIKKPVTKSELQLQSD